MNKFRETFTLTFKVSGKRYCRGGPARRELLDVYLVQAGEIRGPTTAINQTYRVLLACDCAQLHITLPLSGIITAFIRFGS